VIRLKIEFTLDLIIWEQKLIARLKFFDSNRMMKSWFVGLPNYVVRIEIVVEMPLLRDCCRLDAQAHAFRSLLYPC
jgi:hypothetical protein